MAAVPAHPQGRPVQGGRRRGRGVGEGADPTVTGGKSALVAVLLKPAGAAALAQAGKVTVEGDDSVLHTFAGLLDAFDPNVNVVTP